MNKQRGFTLYGLLVTLWVIGCMGISLTIIYWVIRALIKYVGG